MSIVVALGIPIAILGLVLLLGFVGCGLPVGGLPGGGSPFDDIVNGIPSLVAFWHLDEEGGATAKDSKDGHDGGYQSLQLEADDPLQSAAAPGTLQFGQPSLISGEPGKHSIRVNGGWVEVPHTPDLNTPQFTVQLLVRTAWTAADTRAFRCVFSNEDGSAKTGFGLYANPNNSWEAWIGDGATQVFATADKPINLGNKEYLVVTYDGTTLTLYVDSNVRATLAAGFAPTTTPLPATIGIVNGNHWPFVGDLQEVAYYNAALDQQTVTNIGLTTT